MLAKKTRTHSCGQSNIDFRSQNDEINVKRFQPWKVRPNFGTMGSSDFHLKFKEFNESNEAGFKRYEPCDGTGSSLTTTNAFSPITSKKYENHC